MNTEQWRVTYRDNGRSQYTGVSYTREVMHWGDAIDAADTKHRMTREGGTAAYVMRRITQCHSFESKPSLIGAVY